MINLYYWPTPNGHKIPIMLEECGIDYKVFPVNMLKGEQFSKDFLQINPNNKIPAIVDNDGPEGKKVRRVYIEEGSNIVDEIYLSLLVFHFSNVLQL